MEKTILKIIQNRKVAGIVNVILKIKNNVREIGLRNFQT